ncbi:permease [Natrialba sp. SSL1]|uniref:permease n=1 Tax=Natrialba sp. SSL1 TaxID=1869245 RepID=UPI0008F7ED6C|nr:permease [Natrialba sp. SSL1]OIB57675.1 hypothetical protein BBD46_12860 [Natrialba sp. SSL1]
MISSILSTVGDALWTTGYFLWQSLWALLFGFMLSGAIQAFVSKEGMVNYMGDGSPRSIFYASAFGFASTSCSFGDIAATKTLFKKGAHIIPAVAFLIASTNFVIALTFLIWALLGWEFALAQAVGAPIMIVTAVILTHFLIPYDKAAEVRDRLVREEQPVVTDPVCKMRMNRENALAVEFKNETVHFCSGQCKSLFEQNPDTHTTSWREKISSLNGWVEAANQTRRDVKMLGKPLLAGFFIAGFAATVIPDWAWAAFFGAGGEGFTEVLYSSAVGPLVSLVAFVGSMGNIPLAAVLWGSGFLFAGVIAYIYADLIVPQLIHIYRQIFGSKIGNRLTLILYISMATAGFTVYYLFATLDLIPEAAVADPGAGITVFGVDPIFIMNVLFILIGLGFVGLVLRGRKAAPGDQDVEDPVTGAELTVKNADYCTVYDESIYYFESDNSREQFLQSPESYL